MTARLAAQGLAARLREGTREAHTGAERAQVVRRLLKGTLPRALYVEVLARLLPLYTALEAALEANRAHPLIAPIYFPELARTASLRADLRFFSPGAEPSGAPVSPASARIVSHLQAIGRDDPGLLVAHSYTRYLGDLSGGQILGRIVRKAYGLGAEGPGADFYRFDGIPDPAAWKAVYRARLDALPVDEAMAQRLVEEAVAAFGLNGALFAELEPALAPEPADEAEDEP